MSKFVQHVKIIYINILSRGPVYWLIRQSVRIVGNECDFKIRTESELVQKVKKHREEEHGIDLPKEQIIQMAD